jgi:hypothetical protein
MELAHGDLQEALQNTAEGTLGLMPELLKAVVTGVPIRGVEQLNLSLKARVSQQLNLVLQTAVATGLDGS